MRARGALALLLLVKSAEAADATTPGAVTAPYPTLENVSIEWALTGDDDVDATATVRYRKQGEAAYRDALPLLRVPPGESQGFSWTNKLAGSIFGLEPGTTYDIELTLTDPDGGDAIETLSVATRPVPEVPAGAREIDVTPSSIDAALEQSEPGDVLVLGAGSYDEIVVPNDGTDALPIVLRAANAGEAVVEGDVRIDGRSHVYVEDLSVHGKFKFNDAEAIVVRGCTITTPDYGIIAYGSGVTNAVIMNNVIQGPTVWRETSLGTDGDNLGEGVQITGPGNVVAFNRVTGFRDCLSLLEDTEAVNQVSDDFYGNDLAACADDAVEADFSMGNVRVYRNRIRDSFMGLSSQPSLGGPTYFTRNVMYNVLYQAFKLQRSSVGDVGFHNTIVKSGDAFSVNTEDVLSRSLFRNNLFIGGPGATYNGYDSGPGDVMMLPSADTSCSFDYDGYGSIGTGEFGGRVGDVRFASLDEMQTLTSEAHGVAVDLAAFAAAVVLPADPFAAPATPALLLAASGGAVDRGVPLANVNDAYAGDAPDLGAYELGEAEPTYGPTSAGASGSGGTGVGGAAGDATSGGTAGSDAGSGATSQGGTGQGGTGQAGSSRGGANASGASGVATAGGIATSGSGNAGANGGAAGEGDSGGCGCRIPSRRTAGFAGVACIGLAVLVAASRRRRGVWRVRGR